MKSKIINICIILTSMIGYLEWGKGNHMFLFQGEYEVLSKLIFKTSSVMNPFTLFPLFGQLILILTLFQKQANRVLSIIGLGCLSFLLLFMFAIGIMDWNVKIIISTLPFLCIGIIAIRYYSRKKLSAETKTPS